MQYRRLACLLTTIAGFALAPSSSSAAVTLGPDLSAVPGAGQPFAFVAVGCQQSYPSCTYITMHSTNPNAVAAAPTAGVITSWGFRAGMGPQATDETMTLKTYRPGTQDGLSGYTFGVQTGSGPQFVIPAGNQLLAEPTTLPARMPIAAGERVGVTADNDISFAVYNPTAGATSTVFSTGFPPFNGEEYANPFGNTAMAINAKVEPDADGDGYGDETQDCFPADPGSFGGCEPPPGTGTFTPLPIVDPGGSCTGVCGGGAIAILPPPPAPPSGDGSRFYVALQCPATATAPCGGFVIVSTLTGSRPRVSAPGPVPPAPPRASIVLAKSSYEIAPGQSEKLKLTLSKAGRKLLAKKGKLKVSITVQPESGDPVTSKRTLKGKRKKR